MKHVWIVQTGFLGDCVLTLPMIYRLLEADSQVRLKIFSTSSGLSLFEIALERGLKIYRERVELVLFDKKQQHSSLMGLWKLARGQKQKPYAVFCVQRSFRTGLLAYFSGAPFRVGFSSGGASFLYNIFAAREWESAKPEAEKNLDLLRSFYSYQTVQLAAPLVTIPGWGSFSAPSLLACLIKSSSEQNATKVNSKSESKIIGLALGSPWGSKRWSLENAIELCNKLSALGHEIWLIGDKETMSLSMELKSKCPSLLIQDYCGKTTLKELIEKISQMDVLISNDSAPVHLASDLAVPVLALFGPTLPEFGFAPWRKSSLALGVSNLDCRPCHIHGPKVCPKGHHKCMKELKAEYVFGYLQRFLRTS
jgi:heptosyltransferase-2